ncbi:GPI transamidase subunit PIG-U [Chytriomyces cf. hyalinus JEL632]|nr:GPI transamidase subunit PIG-U [Chytriomyces cf. hyalinus JEL632]
MEVLAVLGVVIRLALVQRTDFARTLDQRVEVSTPVTSFKRMQEGVFLWRNNINPYEGGVFHQAPLLLALFHVLDDRMIPYLFILLDILVAKMLVEIAKHRALDLKSQTWRPFFPSKEEKEALLAHESAESKTATKESGVKKSDPTIPTESALVPLFVGVVYLLNPLSIVTCLARSMLVFNTAAVVAGVYFAVKGRKVNSMFFLALASYVSMYPVMFVLPCSILIAKSLKIKPFSASPVSFLLFATFTIALLGVSNVLMGSWDFLESTYGVILLVPDLQPNTGLWWYIFIEMFDQFRLFFLLVFQVFVVAFVVPLSLKFREHPLFVVAVFGIIIATFKSYPAVGDVAAYIPFVFMHQELFKYMKNLYIITHLGFYTCILLPLFYNLWIYAGSGNANFFYAITLIVGVAQVLLLGDFIGAMVRREWERGEGYAFRGRRIEVMLK